MVIESLENSRVKKYKKLKKRKYRDEYKEFIVEGLHSVREAFRSGIVVELILEEGVDLPFESPYVYVTRDIINKISSTDTPSSIMALCKIIDRKEEIGNKVLVLDNIQDPGNLGTIIRSSRAFGIDTVVLGEGCCDLYNEKVIRATQGIGFSMNIISRDINSIIDELKEKEIPVLGTRVTHGEDIRNLTSKDKEKYALIMGNEGRGVSEEILDRCDKYIYIETEDSVDSLNVSIATSILLYELNRK